MPFTQKKKQRKKLQLNPNKIILTIRCFFLGTNIYQFLREVAFGDLLAEQKIYPHLASVNFGPWSQWNRYTRKINVSFFFWLFVVRKCIYIYNDTTLPFILEQISRTVVHSVFKPALVAPRSSKQKDTQNTFVITLMFSLVRFT